MIKPVSEVQPVDLKEVEKKLEEMHIKDLEIGGKRELKGPLATAVWKCQPKIDHL